MLTPKKAKFCIGQVVIDPQFHFRGVIIDVDPDYQGAAEWYEENAPHHPPKNEPWYHLLVHNSSLRAYTAESMLILDNSNEPVNHPEIEYFFSQFDAGVYWLRRGYDM